MLNNNSNSNITCWICLDELNSENGLDKCLNCSNLFHNECLNIWILKNNSCPICRFKFNNDDDDEYFELDLENFIVFSDTDFFYAFLNYYKSLIYDFFFLFF